jgi:hypothetical protein
VRAARGSPGLQRCAGRTPDITADPLALRGPAAAVGYASHSHPGSLGRRFYAVLSDRAAPRLAAPRCWKRRRASESSCGPRQPALPPSRVLTQGLRSAGRETRLCLRRYDCISWDVATDRLQAVWGD